MITISLLLILEIQVKALCREVLPFDKVCIEEVLECTFDEGNAHWCFKDHLDTKYNIKID